MSFKDLFSTQSTDYAKFRPSYPDELFKYLSHLSPYPAVVWDCGTGNGQAAMALAPYFSKVYATDPSEKQLALAPTHPHIEYRLAAAESSGLPAASVDLITVAQAFHWFNQEAFYEEVRRVGRPQGHLVIWSYSLAEINPGVDEVVRKLYAVILEGCWEKERKLVDEGYRDVKTPFLEKKSPAFVMTETWSLEHWVGYLSTWSAVQTYIKKNNKNPLEEIYSELQDQWGNSDRKVIKWPLSVRIFQI